MEARSAAVGSPPLYYMFPSNSGLNPTDAQRIMSLGLPVERILPDLHVGAGGAVEAAASLFSNPPIPGFNTGAINCETNADSHNMQRALDEATDLITWFTYPTNVTSRLYARTASFCTGGSNQFDTWDQGIANFVTDGTTFLQPPGYVHVMISSTWAEVSLASSLTSGNPLTAFASQTTADGKTLVLRMVTGTSAQTVTIVFPPGTTATGPSYTITTLTGAPNGDNTPSTPTAISPSTSTPAISAGVNQVTIILDANTFAVASIPI